MSADAHPDRPNALVRWLRDDTPPSPELVELARQSEALDDAREELDDAVWAARMAELIVGPEAVCAAGDKAIATALREGREAVERIARHPILHRGVWRG